METNQTLKINPNIPITFIHQVSHNALWPVVRRGDLISVTACDELPVDTNGVFLCKNYASGVTEVFFIKYNDAEPDTVILYFINEEDGTTLLKSDFNEDYFLFRATSFIKFIGEYNT